MNADAQQEIFHGRGGFVKLGHFDKRFIKPEFSRIFQYSIKGRGGLPLPL